MDSSKQRYLLYALGEFVLIVIGILVAIQINNLNESRKDQALGKVYIAELHSDIQNDLEQIQLALSRLHEQSNDSKYVLKVMESGGLENQDSAAFMRSLVNSHSGIIPDRTENSWDELKSSGRIFLIADDTLKNFINSFYSEYDIVSSNFHDVAGPIRSEIRSINSKKWDLESIENWLGSELEDSPAKEVYDAVFSDKELMENIRLLIFTCHYNIGWFESLARQAKDLQNYIESHYRNLL